PGEPTASSSRTRSARRSLYAITTLFFPLDVAVVERPSRVAAEQLVIHPRWRCTCGPLRRHAWISESVACGTRYRSRCRGAVDPLVRNPNRRAWLGLSCPVSTPRTSGAAPCRGG